jgi:hypothetical protein
MIEIERIIKHSECGPHNGNIVDERIAFRGFDDQNHHVAIARKIGYFAKVSGLYISVLDPQGERIYINKKSFKKRFSNSVDELQVLAKYFPGIKDQVKINKLIRKIKLPFLLAKLPFLSTNEMKAILKCIEKSEHPTLLSKKIHKLARSVLLTPEGNFLLLTSCSRGNDRLVGQGNYKKVKFALNLETGEKRAVGIIRREGGSDAAWRGVLDEVNMMQRLKGKQGIIQLDTAFVKETSSHEADKIYIIMEYCEAGELFDFFIKGKYLRAEDRFQIALDCATGIKNQHDEGLIHVDVKPENVFLHRKEGRIHGKIGDLGSVCEQNDLIKRNKLAGTAVYFPPEKAKETIAVHNEKNIQAVTTQKGDVWALGVIFYVLFNPRYEFFKFQSTEGFPSIMKMIAELTQKDLNNQIANSKMNPKFKPLITGMLQCDPEQRLTINQVVNHLNQLA